MSQADFEFVDIYDPQLEIVDEFDEFDAVDISGTPLLALTPVAAGPPGPPAEVVEYYMPVPQTTALISHDLGRDPVGIQVIVDGTQREEYSVSFPNPGNTVLIGFDVTVQALIRLI